MKLPLLSVIVVAALTAPHSQAQVLQHASAMVPAGARAVLEPPSVLTRPALIAVRRANLADALQLLSERARVPIAFSASLLPDRRHRVDCPCENATVGAALEQMLAGTPLTFREVHEQVVIFPLVPAQPGPPLQAPFPGLRESYVELSGQPWSDGAAQQRVAVPGSIRGKVMEVGSARGLSGAQVSIVGRGRSAVTNAAGDYVLAGVPDGVLRIRAQMIGYSSVEQTVTVAENQVVSLNFELATAPVILDDIVVTGTGLPVERRRVGNAITSINVVDVVDRANNVTVAELLQSNAPGVTVLESSGSPGAAGNIRIRGVTSLAGTSEPVVFVDGVRIQSGAGGSFRNNWENTNQNQAYAGGGQTASALDAINPEDIESIEVIKGPAAATLYSGEAANGVIQIITRRGRSGDQDLQWRFRSQLGGSGWGLDERPSRTTCDAVRLANPTEWPGCQGLAAGTVLTESYLGGALRSGATRNMLLSVNGGGRGYSFYAAIDDDLEEGIFTNSSNQRTSARANFSFLPSDRVDFAVNLAYSRTDTRFPMSDNGPNVLEAAWTYQPGRVPQPGQTYGFAGGTPAQYELYDNRVSGDRVMIGTTLTYRPTTWFTHRLIVGGDINSRQANRYIGPNGLFSPTQGQMTQGAPHSNYYTVDYSGSVDHRLPLGNLPSTFSFGIQYTDQQYRNTIAQGTGFSTDLVRNVGSASQRFSWDEHSQVKTLGFYGQQQVAWRDRLYLTAALRVDNSSVFGDNINRILYPKLSLAYIVSEESFLQGRLRWLDQLKLRFAWGQAGNAPNPFAKVTTYGIVQTIDPDSGTVVSAVRLLTLGNPQVKPERGTETEFGFDAALLGSRLGVEFTFYNKTTHDALMQFPLTPSQAGISGGTQLRNLGEINNRGIEVALQASPIRSRRLTWDARLGLSTNRNRLVQFGFPTQPILLGVTTLNQRHVEGYPLAGYWVHDPVFDATSGTYVASPARFAGPSMPTREASLGNTFTLLGNLRLHTQLDYKGGHYLLNMTDWRRCRAQLCEEVNDPNATPQRVAELQADLGANDALYTQRADFIKLRELSLTYTLPSAWIRRVRADRVAVTLAGHNLGYLWKPYYRGLDPEVTFNGINQPGGDGQTFGWVRMDYWTVPMLRRLTMSVDVSF